ncbi:hypothetical protein BaRGS_00018387 [Batillaria attramentaria]|uniref:Uncharacterized protein n=1 Tax=Batillaria attramentaria TaxID=370345 RepID=A0ABD0KTS2_9CAEN
MCHSISSRLRRQLDPSTSLSVSTDYHVTVPRRVAELLVASSSLVMTLINILSLRLPGAPVKFSEKKEIDGDYAS